MITFFCCLLVLLIGSQIYGRALEKGFGPDDRATPAERLGDGVDYVKLPTWRVFLIQLLNIAGTGPIFGALMGAVFGPVVYLWIVLGSILGGAVHDYLCGMISARMDGMAISEVVGKYLGRGMAYLMRVFSVILLVLVGAVFTSSPAALLAKLTPAVLNYNFWLIVVMAYFILATLMPIDKLIAKLYPFFGAALILMAVLIPGALIAGGYRMPELSLVNQHPSSLPMWPYMFVTVACGAISGFHSTQSPLMARCIGSEKDGRKVFAGAMIAEGVIALIWASAGVAFYGATGGLQSALSSLGQSGVVYEISTTLLGAAGGVLAIIGVVACPITSGDTALRSARLTIADWLHIDQKPFGKRLLTALPCLLATAVLTQVDFNVVWRYFSWSNQTLAAIALWAGAAYLRENGAGKRAYLYAALPATFMTAVSGSYLFSAGEMLNLPIAIGRAAGALLAAAAAGYFVYRVRRDEKLSGGKDGAAL